MELYFDENLSEAVVSARAANFPGSVHVRETGRAGQSGRTQREAMMHDIQWSVPEKKIARQVFESALLAELAEVIADFKHRAGAASTADDLWSIEEYLHRRRREIDEKYDYRYSQLLLIFGRLLREGRIDESQLAGLGADKLSFIRRIGGL